MNSTISGNVTPQTGGGIINNKVWLYPGDGTVTVINSTIYGNSAYQAAAIFNSGNQDEFDDGCSFVGNLLVINSTLIGNRLTIDGAIDNEICGSAILNNIIVADSGPQRELYIGWRFHFARPQSVG